jgi:hypothetical protein
VPSKWEHVDRAFKFLSVAHRDGTSFSIAQLAEATGWSESTVRTYATKKWSTILRQEGENFRCTEKFKKFTSSSFRIHQSQVSSPDPTLSDLLLSKAVAACISAIEVYNKPDFRFRNENFAILIINAWELLLKARILLDSDDNIEDIYARDKTGAVLNSKSGNPRTISLMTAAERLHASGIVTRAALENLKILSCIRDEAVHLAAEDFEMNRRLQEVGVAGVRNFATAATGWFGYDFGQFNMFLMPLSFSGSVNTEIVGTRTVQAERIFRFVSSIQDAESNDDDPDFSVALRLDARFVKTDAADALNVRISRDPSATPIRLTDDDLFERFPYTHAQLIDVLRGRYSDFKQNGEFNERLARLRDEMDGFFVERRLNPKNPRSAYQRFYHSKAVEAFDRYYTRLSTPG